MSTAIAESHARTDYGKALASHGITTIALNDDGEIVLYTPNGSSTVLDDQA